MKKEESSQEYNIFLEGLVIEEVSKDFNFNIKLKYKGKKRFGGSNITTYYFIDELGIEWSRDVGDRVWFSIATRSPRFRARIAK